MREPPAYAQQDALGGGGTSDRAEAHPHACSLDGGRNQHEELDARECIGDGCLEQVTFEKGVPDKGQILDQIAEPLVSRPEPRDDSTIDDRLDGPRHGLQGLEPLVAHDALDRAA